MERKKFARLPGNRRVVQVTPRGVYFVSIPKEIALDYGLTKGAIVLFKRSGRHLELWNVSRDVARRKKEEPM